MNPVYRVARERYRGATRPARFYISERVRDIRKPLYDWTDALVSVVYDALYRSYRIVTKVGREKVIHKKH